MSHHIVDTFIHDADASQPRITILIDAGVPLPDGERVLRDHMIREFVDELVQAIRAYYDARRLAGPPNREIDAGKLAAAIAETDPAME